MLQFFANATASPCHGSNHADLNHIRQRLLIEQTNLCAADLIIVFGNRHIIDQEAEQAAALFHQGYAPLIAATGGVLTDDDQVKAHKIKAKLLSLDVPDTAIILEDSSENTQENVLNTKSIMADKFPDSNIKRVIGVGTVVAGRRFLMTLAKHWPEVRLPMACNVNPFNVSVDNWHQCPVFKETALSEYQKLDTYEDKDWIQDINLGVLNQRIMAASQAGAIKNAGAKKPCHLMPTGAN